MNPCEVCYYKIVERILLHVAHDLSSKCTLDQLAALGNVSRATLCRAYVEITGVSPGKFHLSLRMQGVAGELAHGVLMISEIGPAVGYEDGSSLDHQFGGDFGKTPSEYRETNRGVAGPYTVSPRLLDRPVTLTYDRLQLVSFELPQALDAQQTEFSPARD